MFNASIAQVSTVTNLTYSWTFQPLPLSMLAKTAAAAGGNVLGLPDTDMPLVIAEVGASYSELADHALINKVTRQLLSDVEKYAASMGVLEHWKYAGYASSDQFANDGYQGDNGAFLKRVSRKYDNQQLFQKAVPGGFKL